MASDVAACGGQGTREKKFGADLAAIRAMSTVLPGALPVAVNGVRVAASIRPRKFVIAGGDETPVTMPRTAFQVVYPDCTSCSIPDWTRPRTIPSARTSPSPIIPSNSPRLRARSMPRA